MPEVDECVVVLVGGEGEALDGRGLSGTVGRDQLSDERWLRLAYDYRGECPQHDEMVSDEVVTRPLRASLLTNGGACPRGGLF